MPTALGPAFLTPLQLRRALAVATPNAVGANPGAGLLSTNAVLAMSFLLFTSTLVYIGAKRLNLRYSVFNTRTRVLADHCGAGFETLLTCLPRLLLERCGVSSHQTARAQLLVSPRSTSLAAACFIAVVLYRSRTRPGGFGFTRTASLLPLLRPLCLARLLLERCGVSSFLLASVPASVPAPAAAPKSYRGKRGGRGDHVAARDETRELARLARFEEYVLTHKLYNHFMKEQGFDESDPDDSYFDKRWVHPSDAYFGEVLTTGLAGYSSDECDNDDTDDAGYEPAARVRHALGVSGTGS
jgi:hypothetical protein